jgi:hypothetical protein
MRGDYAEILEDAGIKAQARAPMTPVAKLVFGAGYDKTRLTEFAAALSFARRQALPSGGMPLSSMASKAPQGRGPGRAPGAPSCAKSVAPAIRWRRCAGRSHRLSDLPQATRSSCC